MTVPLLTESGTELRDPLPILFVGVGHAGGKLIAHLPRRVPELNFAGVDTDQASLHELPFDRKILLGEGLANGQGTGGDADLARRCVEASPGAADALFQDMRVMILVAGLGGGTGGGAGPLLAELARENGLTVIAALVQPLDAEGGTRRQAAEHALAAYREACDAVMLFPLEALREAEDPRMLLARLLKRCGMEIGRALGGLAMLLRSGWLIPLRLQDLVQVMRRADGYCRLAAVSADGDQRVSKALDQLFAHPLIDRGSLLAHSGGVVLGMLCGPQTSVADLDRISFEIRKILRSDAELKIGVAQEDRFGQHLALVVMVAERWSAKTLPLPVSTEDQGSDAEANPETSGESGRLVQGEIALQVPSKGRFKDIEPTIVAGADLDTPTFIRKGHKLSFQRSGKS